MGTITPAGICFVLSNCKDAQREPEFNDWYVNTHIPDALAPGIYQNPARFENAEAKGGAESPKFLATYEIFRDDLRAAWTEQRAQSGKLYEQGRMSDLFEVGLVALFKRLGRTTGPTQGKAVTGALVVMTSPKEPGLDEEFNRWYDEVHIPDILGIGPYVAATRYVNLDTSPDEARYLTIYDTDLEEPMKGLGKMMEAMPALAQRGRIYDGVDLKLMAPFTLTYSRVTEPAGAAARP